MEENIHIIIDGENFRRNSSFKDLSDNKIIEILDNNIKNNFKKYNKKEYFYSRITKNERLFEESSDIKKKFEDLNKKQRNLIRLLKERGFECVRSGKVAGYKVDIKSMLLTKTGYEFKEKGVDVGIAVQMIRHSIKNKGNCNIVLFSSDTDLIPAINFCRELGVNITYMYFEGNKNNRISKLSTESVKI